MRLVINREFFIAYVNRSGWHPEETRGNPEKMRRIAKACSWYHDMKRRGVHNAFEKAMPDLCTFSQAEANIRVISSISVEGYPAVPPPPAKPESRIPHPEEGGMNIATGYPVPQPDNPTKREESRTERKKREDREWLVRVNKRKYEEKREQERRARLAEGRRKQARIRRLEREKREREAKKEAEKLLLEFQKSNIPIPREVFKHLGQYIPKKIRKWMYRGLCYESAVAMATTKARKINRQWSFNNSDGVDDRIYTLHAYFEEALALDRENFVWDPHHSGYYRKPREYVTTNQQPLPLHEIFR